MFAHVNERHQPQMVDVSHKPSTDRRAVAQAIMRLPAPFVTHINNGEILLPKGPVLQTAIVAGTMAVKKTAEAIPFCHPLPISSCRFETELIPKDNALEIRLRCEVKTTAPTGVEMESLHGVSIAALTVYDMAKSVSPDIVIQEIRLLAKSGGQQTRGQYPLYGLVLTGGRSRRMGRDKALLTYHQGRPHAQYLYELLGSYCERVFLSARPGQWSGTPLAELPTLADALPSEGPLSGLLTAFRAYPQVNWLVVACDLPYVNPENLAPLVCQYREDVVATCYRHPQTHAPEALCAIYTPQARVILEQAYQRGERCPVRILSRVPCHVLDPPDAQTTTNINTPQEYAHVQAQTG